MIKSAPDRVAFANRTSGEDMQILIEWKPFRLVS